MKVVLDADCLIKLTKSGIKEDVCRAFSITLPLAVKVEVVDRGKEKQFPDAFMVEKNLHEGLLQVKKYGKTGKRVDGEREALDLFQRGGFDAIGSDDRRFIRQLILFDVPYITPAVFIALMVKQGSMNIADAHERLMKLSEYISDDEYTAVKLWLDSGRFT